MGDPARDVSIAETLSGHPVVAITINHENLDKAGVEEWKKRLGDRFGKPVTDVLFDGPQPLVDAVVKRFSLVKR
jgi:uncharacterized NAD-dependent epimerase/dehydratase family protein